MKPLTVQLFVDDPDAASYFYLDLFRAAVLRRIEEEGTAREIEMEIEGVPFCLIRDSGVKIPPNALAFRVAVEKDRVASLYEDALERDAAPVKAPSVLTEAWITTACFDDPFGFRWQLFHREETGK